VEQKDREMSVNKQETGMSNMKQQEIFDALVRQLLASGEDQATAAKRAQSMINGWNYFSSNSVDDRGHETCRDWMDPEIVRLLDEALSLQYAEEK
jgi:hypothetical protein